MAQHISIESGNGFVMSRWQSSYVTPCDITKPECVKARPHPSYRLLYAPFPSFSARTATIVQLSAVSGSEEFNRYVLPRRPISKEASAITKLWFGDGKLSYRGQHVHAVPLETCLVDFPEFLQKFPKPLKLFRSSHPHLSSHHQEYLVTSILNEVYNAHNSLDDVKILERIVARADVWLQSKFQHTPPPPTPIPTPHSHPHPG